MRHLNSLILCAFAILTAGGMSTLFAADAKPKAIKQIMKQMKAPVDKVKKGNATDADKKKLLELYTDLGKNKPPVGDADNWKKLTSALVDATQDLVDDKQGAVDEFNKAVDCAKCHTAHRRK